MLTRLLNAFFDKRSSVDRLYDKLEPEQLRDLIHKLAMDERLAPNSKRLLMAAIVQQESTIEAKESMIDSLD